MARQLTTITTARGVVLALGGTKAVCKLVSAKPKSVYHWTGGVKRFPTRHYDTMLRALEAQHKTAPARLWNQSKGKS